MTPVVEAALKSWSIPPAATLALCALALVYLRGWWRLRRAGVPFVPLWRAISFTFGLLLVWVALASPLDTFSGFVLTSHMLQHMLLMMAAPPLILLGAPVVPLIRGLPDFAAREFAGPFLNWPIGQRVGHMLANPICGLVVMGLVMFAWHVSRLYELALHSAAWHQVEHACFFIAALIFWWPVVQPWPSRAQSPRWTIVPYLMLGDVQNTALSAILIFSDRVLYPSYAVMPRLFGSALEDQAAAGAIMWVVGSLAFVIPAVAIAVQCLSTKASRSKGVPDGASRIAPSAVPLSHLPRIPLVSSRLRRSVEATSFLVLFLVVGLCFGALASQDSSDDDNQALRFKGQSGPFLVAIFSQPEDLRSGRNNFGILVQDRDTQDLQLDATIDLTLVARDDTTPVSTAHAVPAQAQNELLQTAELNLPNEGNWRMHVAVRHHSQSADFEFPLHVVKRRTTLYPYIWPYAALGALGTILLLVYFQRHRESKSVRIENPAPSPEGGFDRHHAF